MGKLNAALPNSEVKVVIFTPTGEDAGFSIIFKPWDARTDAGYTNIIQRGARQRKPTTDEAIRYVFRHKFDKVEGLAKEDVADYGLGEEQVSLFERSPLDFFLNVPEMWVLVRLAVNAYFERVLPDSGDSKSGS